LIIFHKIKITFGLTSSSSGSSASRLAAGNCSILGLLLLLLLDAMLPDSETMNPHSDIKLVIGSLLLLAQHLSIFQTNTTATKVAQPPDTDNVGNVGFQFQWGRRTRPQMDP